MSVESVQLANGLTIVSEHMPHLESASLGVWIKSGARNETDSEHGVAHLLEHMAFKGTKSRTAREIVEQVENVGGDVNAATSAETTAYYARVLGDDVPLAVDILHDILSNSTLEEEELAREKHVVLQEIGASKDMPDDVVYDHFQAVAFADQAIGRPILGTPETVAAITRDDLKRFLAKHYRGPNVVLSCAGSMRHEELVALAKDRFADFDAATGEEPEPASYVGGGHLEERDLMETQIVMGFEGRAYHVRDFYASQLLAAILGGGMSSRLFQEVREKHGLCYSIYAFHQGFSDTGIFGIHAATGPDDVGELMSVIIEELNSAIDTISVEETDRARAQIRANLLMSHESPAARAGQIARQILLFGRPVSNEELMERLDAISVERIRDLAGRIFRTGAPTVAAVGAVKDMIDHGEVASGLGMVPAMAAQ